MHLTIRPIGNSRGIVIPKPILAQLGFEQEIEMTVEGDTLVLRKRMKPAREGWAEASAKLAASGDDALIMGEFGNDGDTDLQW